MTDKVQKIKDWISKEQDGLMDANGNFEYPEHEGAYHILCNLDAYIDSLQEEPVSENLETDIAIRLGGVCHKQVWHKNHFSKEDCKAYCSLYKECQECSLDLCMIFFHDPHCHFEEEPVSIWHDASEETPTSGSNILMIRKEEKDTNYPPIAGCFHGTNSRLDGKNWGYYNGFCYNEIEAPYKWAYVDDLLNLSNVERIGKDWKEPVSEDLSAEIDTYIKDNFSIDKEQLDRFGIEEKDYMYSMDKSDILTMVKYFTNLQKEKDIKIITDVEAVAFANGMAQMKKQIEESVSENLEEAALEYANNQLIKSGVTDTNCPRELAVAQASLMVNGFKAGAKWQKEQDKETIELAEDHAMLAGMEKMKEQMMRGAVDGIVYSQRKDMAIVRSNIFFPTDLKKGDKVKLIIIKED